VVEVATKGARGAAIVRQEGKTNGVLPGTVKLDEEFTEAAAPFSHPYFWAPFILIGNWK
jgi:CHAT domain-containing protein